MLGGVHSLLEALFTSVMMVADESSLEEAVGAVKPDLVVVDLSLPRARDRNDMNLIRQLTREHPNLRLVVLSVHDDPTAAAEVRAAGAAGYVLKRSVAADLVPAVRAVLSGGEFVSPAVRWPNPTLGQDSATDRTNKEHDK
jgi:DNA-binding NarL/FixJ family response regulator